MRAHVSLNVKNVPESIQFYEKIFGVKPQKQTSTYAKFDLKNPSLNFSMQSGGEVSRVSHFGIEVDSAEEVAKWEKQLQDLGVIGQSEKDTDCCFARQDKVWFEDPDGNAWEVFYVHEQLPVSEEKPINKKASSCAPGAGCC